LLIFVGLGGICVAVRTLGHLRESSERQLRAYVFPETVDILEGMMLQPPLLQKQNVPWVHMTIKNSGQTPAYDVVSWLQIAVVALEQENTLVFPTPMQQVSANNLGPGSMMTKGLWFDRPITAPEVQEIQSVQKGIYAYGRIEYRDAFGTNHFTNFRLRYNGKFPPLPNSIFNFCEGGNDAN